MDRISDEALMAYADEALPQAEMRRLAALVARDAELAARLKPFIVTRTALPQIFSDAHLGPIPRRLLDTVMSAPIGISKRPVETPGILAGLRNLLFPESLSFGRAAFALCGTLLVVAGAGWMMSRAGPQGDAPDLLAMENGKTLARGVLARALETSPMLQQVAAADGMTATPVVTFKNTDGQLCRQFEATRSKTDVFSGYACRNDAGDWQVGFQGTGPSLVPGDGASGEIRPADRQSNADLDVAIDAIISGDALDSESENSLISNGWNSKALKKSD